jgi:hypothetical protein
VDEFSITSPPSRLPDALNTPSYDIASQSRPTYKPNSLDRHGKSGIAIHSVPYVRSGRVSRICGWCRTCPVTLIKQAPRGKASLVESAE